MSERSVEFTAKEVGGGQVLKFGVECPIIGVSSGRTSVEGIVVMDMVGFGGVGCGVLG